MTPPQENFYEVTMAYLYEANGSKEKSLDMLFCSFNDKTATVDGIRWVLNRCKALPDLFKKVGCVKISQYFIEPVEENGYCRSHRTFPFYEWKHDTSPNTLEQELKLACERVKRD
jgi:hypothetical protein